MGIAPYQYLMQQRVERAKQLLKQQAISISDIALDCGFANQTYLTKVFRQMTGGDTQSLSKAMIQSEFWGYNLRPARCKPNSSNQRR